MNSFIACSAFCPGYQTVTPWTPRNDCVYASQAPRWRATMARHAWRVDKAPAKTHKNRNARLDALRSDVPKRLSVFTTYDANWLIIGSSEARILYRKVLDYSNTVESQFLFSRWNQNTESPKPTCTCSWEKRYSCPAPPSLNHACEFTIHVCFHMYVSRFAVCTLWIRPYHKNPSSTIKIRDRHMC